MANGTIKLFVLHLEDKDKHRSMKNLSAVLLTYLRIYFLYDLNLFF